MRRNSVVALSLFSGIKGHLRAILQDRGLSYSEVARLLGVNRATVRRWLRDDDPNCIDLLGLAELSYHLAVPVQQLLPITPWGNGQQQIYGFDERDRALLGDLLTRIKADYQPKRSRRAK
ncbi:helix-turn-helix domain-containing protein [Aeromonas salmonicida]|jgi:transcriptional regulator with XRE-family HTH domain|uniref:helix-turn-helix domain-containing protein n=1 Tax=Aeromonas salmonicida TaxID=645 RepID=UPI003BF50589